MPNAKRHFRHSNSQLPGGGPLSRVEGLLQILPPVPTGTERRVGEKAGLQANPRLVFIGVDE